MPTQKELEQKREFFDEIMRCQCDPYRFVMLVFPWGKKGTELEKFSGPDEWHKDMFAKLKTGCLENQKRASEGKEMRNQQFAVKSGHGIGKSASVSWLILWLMYTRIGCKGVVTANTENQLKTKTWPELKKWHRLMSPLCQDLFKWSATTFQAVGDPEWRMDCIPWSENSTEGFAGLHIASVI